MNESKKNPEALFSQCLRLYEGCDSRPAPQLIEAVNLAYHEEEALVYTGQHPEIFRDESERWARIAEHIASLRGEKNETLRILDVGVGTGFVPKSLMGVLHEEDELVMTDLSQAMLNKARDAVLGFRGKKSFHAVSAEKLDFPDFSFDAITLNSVLHHLSDGLYVLKKLSRMLKSGGVLIIAHEPNIRHFKHPIVGGCDRLLRLLKLLRYRNFGRVKTSPFIERVNNRLLKRRVIDRPMTTEEIESLVDIQSPTAGRTIRSGRGFDPKSLPMQLNLKVVLLETYRHLGKAGPSLLRELGWFPSWLEKRFPDEGALFTIILKKR